MRRKLFALILLTIVSSCPRAALAEIISNTTDTLDLTNAKEAPLNAKWSDPDRITVTPEGLGWGNRDDNASRDVWLQSKPIGICLSWRPTFFEKSTPFIGYVEFLYEAQLRGGQRIKSLQVEVNWSVSAKHLAPKDESTQKGREVPWRFKTA